jgi:hypothetical protein
LLHVRRQAQINSLGDCCGFLAGHQAQDSSSGGKRGEAELRRKISAGVADALGPLETDWHKEFLETAPWLIVIFRIEYGIAEGAGEIEKLATGMTSRS